MPNVKLFQIRGTTELNTRAVEVNARAASLNSNDVFLVKSPEKAFIWEGSVSINISDYLTLCLFSNFQ